MRKFHGWLILVTCATFCKIQYFDGGYDIEGSPEECFCGDRIKKTTPTPLEITLTWARKIDPDRISEANGARIRYELGE